jgi:hypothetical protein
VKLTDAIIRQSATHEQVAASNGQVVAELERFRAALTSTPNLIERVAGGRPRHAFAALVVVVALSATIASCTALLWVAP